MCQIKDYLNFRSQGMWKHIRHIEQYQERSEMIRILPLMVQEHIQVVL